MCDEETEKDAAEYLKSNLSRREFNTLAAGAAVMMTLPAVAGAVPVTSTDVEVTTPDGIADCLFVRPAEGSHPAVLLWPDIRGLRPSFRMMATRLAESGYAVLCVNPFYRGSRAPVVSEGESFGDPDVRARIMPWYMQLTQEANFSDAKAFVGWLDAQEAVDTSRKVGTMGYCMGGPIIMRTAAAVPDRIGAAASFHGGGLVTDREDSPHLLIPKMKARLLIAVAEKDDEREPVTKDVLNDRFAEHDLDAEIEVYKGTLHGWCVLDSDVYHEAQAERAWGRLLALFEAGL